MDHKINFMGGADIMQIGVISDTHLSSKSNKLPDALLERLKNVDLIIHAGDHVSLGVSNKLEKLGPSLKAVYGNVDQLSVKNKLPEKITFVYHTFKISIIHGHQFRGDIISKLHYEFPESDIIIFGHTHQPTQLREKGTLFFNPGSPTDKRSQPHHTYGIIDITDHIEAKIINL